MGQTVLVHALAVDDSRVRLVNWSTALLVRSEGEDGEESVRDGQDRTLMERSPHDLPLIARIQDEDEEENGDCLGEDAPLPDWDVDPFAWMGWEEAREAVAEAVSFADPEGDEEQVFLGGYQKEGGAP